MTHSLHEQSSYTAKEKYVMRRESVSCFHPQKLFVEFFYSLFLFPLFIFEPKEHGSEHLFTNAHQRAHRQDIRQTKGSCPGNRKVSRRAVSSSNGRADGCCCCRLVRENEDSNERITQIVDALVQEFVYSNNPYARYGGLIGLAATSIALGPVGGSITRTCRMHSHG